MFTATYTIRTAGHHDADALVRLAQLDSRRPLTGRVLVAEGDDGIVAARSLDDGRVAADPFVATTGAQVLLRARAEALDTAVRPATRRDRWRAGVSAPLRRAGRASAV